LSDIRFCFFRHFNEREGGEKGPRKRERKWALLGGMVVVWSRTDFCIHTAVTVVKTWRMDVLTMILIEREILIS
jgi:hypothetical protein